MTAPTEYPITRPFQARTPGIIATGVTYRHGEPVPYTVAEPSACPVVFPVIADPEDMTDAEFAAAVAADQDFDAWYEAQRAEAGKHGICVDIVPSDRGDYETFQFACVCSERGGKYLFEMDAFEEGQRHRKGEAIR